MSLIVILILILLGLFGVSADPVVVEGPDCAQDGSDGCVQAVTPWEPVTIGGVEGVIVAEADGGLFVGQEGYFKPTTDQLTAAELAIAREQGVLDHQRQYVGYIENGERKLFVNGFCDSSGQDWHAEPILVADGGECYFTAIYNLDTSELERFTYNGEA